jgi:hypothetical protein
MPGIEERNMSEPIATTEPRGWRKLLASRRPFRPFVMIAVVPFIAFAMGGGLVALAELHRPSMVLALTPAPVAAMRDGSPIAVKGQVAEIFGNKFILQDGSGLALVETGPEGEGGNLVAPSETVTVQGRFERGFIHAAAISHADGRSDILGPIGAPPPPGMLSWGGWAHRILSLPRG